MRPADELETIALAIATEDADARLTRFSRR